MQKAYTFAVLGADKRLDYTTSALQDRGFSVTLNPALSDLHRYKAVVLPVPVRPDEETVKILDALHEGCTVFGGNVPDALRHILEEKGVIVQDYAAREEFAVRNAIPTAEGTAMLLSSLLPITIHHAKIFVTGFGRTARALGKLFAAMGAQVTVFARRCSALHMAESQGFTALYLSELAGHIAKADAVVNTVPALVLNAEVLRNVRKDCPIIDIASSPYGTDFSAAEAMSLHAQTAPGLPGKTAPKTAGEIIAETILNILREGNE